MQVSVGTLLAFTMVAISVLILRYVPPDEIPLPPSFQEAIDSVALCYGNRDISVENVKVNSLLDESTPLLTNKHTAAEYLLVDRAIAKFFSMLFLL